MGLHISKYQNDCGFTLIELVVIIVVLGIVAGTAIPKYQDISIDAKESACKSALGNLRDGISIYNADNITKTGSIAYPEIDSLENVGTVMEFSIPENPFQNESNAPDSIVEGITRGVIVGTRGGWAYKQSTGEIWPNTSTTIPGNGCSGPTDINENNW